MLNNNNLNENPYKNMSLNELKQELKRFKNLENNAEPCFNNYEKDLINEVLIIKYNKYLIKEF